MKAKCWLIFNFLLIINISYGQFGSVNYIDTINPGQITKIGSGDFNNDGFTDIILLNNEWPHDKIKVYYNNSGNGYSVANVILPTDTFTNLHNLAVADINNDGWQDILVSQEFPNSLILIQNNAGIFSSQIFDQNLDFPTRIIIHDFDNNGFMDVLSLQHLEVVIYKQSNGLFSSPVVIHSGTEFYDINIDDFNNDGHTDIVIASIGFEIFLNDGNANFTWQSNAGNGITFNLGTGDIDKDGNNDIITWEALQGILFYKNDGLGNFMFQDTTLQHTDNFVSFVVHDFDHDNDLDVYTTIGQAGEAIWIQNNGTGIYSPYSVIHQEQGELLYEVHATDINNDNRLDIIWGGKKLAYHLNTFPAGVTNNTYVNEILVYPNTAIDKFNIKNNHTEKLFIEIYNKWGQRINTGIIVNAAEVINFSLETGFYFLVLKSEDYSVIKTEKLIVR